MYNVKERERNLYSFVISYVYPVSHETRFMEFFIIFIFCVVRTGTRGGGVESETKWTSCTFHFKTVPLIRRRLIGSDTFLAPQSTFYPKRFLLFAVS